MEIKLTNNFNIFKTGNKYQIFPSNDKNDKLISKIILLEKFIEENKLNDFANNLRKILEMIFENNENKKLWQSFKEYIDEIYYRIDKNISQSFKYLRNISNDGSHYSENNVLNHPKAVFCLNALYDLIKYRKNIIEIDHNFEDEAYHVERYNNRIIPSKSNFESKLDLIHSKEISIGKLIIENKYKFLIPSYQRNYDWEKENIEKLLLDIKDKINNTSSPFHYLGSIALSKKDNDDYYSIIDGQQRITSIIIILKAIHKIAIQKGHKDKLSNLENFFNNEIESFYKNPGILEEHINLVKTIFKSSKNEDANNQWLISNNEKHLNGIKNYQFAWEWINDWLDKNKKNNLFDFYETLTVNFVFSKVIFKSSITDQIDVFNNLNTGGKPLSSWDLIKNYFFIKLEDKILIKNHEKLNRIINNNFPNKINKKDLKQSLEKFFIVFSRYKYVTKKEKILEESDSYKAFKLVWPENKNLKFKNFDKLKKEIAKISTYYKIYNQILNGYQEANSPLKKLGFILKFLSQKSVLYPLMIKILKENSEIDEEGIKKLKRPQKIFRLFRILEIYLIKFMVVNGTGFSQAKDFDKFILNHNKEINEQNLIIFLKNDISPSLPNHTEFKQALLKNSILLLLRKQILLNVEIKLLNKGLNYESIFFSDKNQDLNSTYEHIIAKNNNFEAYKKYDKNKIDKKDFENKKDTHLEKIGNGLIISNAKNKKASNKSFFDKRYENAYSSSKLAEGVFDEENKEIIMDLLNKEKKHFSFEDIDKRTKQIVEYIDDIYDIEKI